MKQTPYRAFHGGSFDLYPFRVGVKSSFVMDINSFTFKLQQK